MSHRLRASSRASISVAFLLALAAFAPGASATDEEFERSAALRNRVTVAGVDRHLDYFQEVAEANGGSRFAGLPGHLASALYVHDQLADAGYQPWYQFFTYNAFYERTPSELERITPQPTTFVNGIDFRIMTYSGGGTPNRPVSVPSGDFRGCSASDFAGFPAGNIALVSRGTPAGFPVACTFRLKTETAAAAGASGILIYNNVPGLLNGTLGEGPLSAIPSFGLPQDLGQTLASQVPSGLTMRMAADTNTTPLDTMNVFAELPGKSEDVILVGAHLDSVSAGPGINDNGSGSASILETAIQMKKVNKKPWNTVRFAWWTAEESSLVGSTRYAESLSADELARIDLNLNFDMVASPNFVRFVYDGDNSAFPAGVNGVQAGPPGSGEIERVFHDYFAAAGLASSETPFNGRSDYGPFITRGIPAGGLFTGAEGVKTASEASIYGGNAGEAYDHCYHAACDTTANVNATALGQMADAVAHATIIFANRHFADDPLVNGALATGVGTGDSGGLNPPEREFSR